MRGDVSNPNPSPTLTLTLTPSLTLTLTLTLTRCEEMYRGTLLRRMLAETCPGCEACDDGCEHASAEKAEPIPGFSYHTQRDAAQAHELEAVQPARPDQPRFLAMGGPGERLKALARLIRRGRGECVPAGPDVLVVPVRMGDKIPQQAEEVSPSPSRNPNPNPSPSPSPDPSPNPDPSPTPEPNPNQGMESAPPDPNP